MKLIVKSSVWDDLREIGSQIAEDNPDAANRFFTAAKEAFELIRRHPRIGRVRSFSLAGVLLGDPRFSELPGFLSADRN